MIITLCSWIIMTILFFLWGLLGNKAIHTFFDYEIKGFFSVQITGIVCLTVYAEIFSLFYKVGKLAFILAVGLAAVSLIVNLRYIKEKIERKKNCYCQLSNREKVGIICLAICVLYTALYFSSKSPTNWDSRNYHIQAIRWIEEYGAVKGLGNLHTRFAYNSSFLCLQAFFSFVWIYGKSMHSLNGYFWLFFVGYCISSWQRKSNQNILLSNIMRVLLLSLLFSSRILYDIDISSPNTDFLPMCITAYIFIKWCSLNEKCENNTVSYVLLCFLAIFNVSVKLSAVALVLYAIKPGSEMIKEGKYGCFAKSLMTGVLIISPFLVRNVITSGYLLYPYPKLDIFNFDWKIPRITAMSDAMAIVMSNRYWVKGSFFVWFPNYIKKELRYYDALNVADIFICILLMGYLLKNIKNANKWKYDYIVIFTAIVGYMFLINSALGFRFGAWWMIMVAVLFIFICIEKYVCISIRIPLPIICGMLSFTIVANQAAAFIKDEGNKNTLFTIFPSDYYEEYDPDAYVEINNIKFYYNYSHGKEYGKNVYAGFPGTETEYTLERIEMRGDSLDDGFKAKDEYRDNPYNFQGVLINGRDLEDRIIE